jgi:hypothetical protein
MDEASDALNHVFGSAVPDDEVLFQLPVTITWLHQVMVGLQQFVSRREGVHARSAGRVRQPGPRGRSARSTMGRTSQPFEPAKQT